MVRIDLGSLNVSRRRDPQGFYVAIIGKERAAIIIDAVEELGLDIESSGDVIMIRSKSWAKLASLMSRAKARGLRVIND
ncbi:hypothetical protein GCM10007981_02310 [Thermocladium modestius]|uniref:Uncharacterized protein n=1 Tax=Thermocladium modestius TaxID=62609 RepID=A0A830GRW0_9CREN|nr:hypothetical protein [Thermocladium modestius]GGP19276.1 hypothetical protein GCM10007981_02310 [Thermocladium modestius]